jgi:hypothetical protein
MSLTLNKPIHETTSTRLPIFIGQIYSDAVGDNKLNVSFKRQKSGVQIININVWWSQHTCSSVLVMADLISVEIYNIPTHTMLFLGRLKTLFNKEVDYTMRSMIITLNFPIDQLLSDEKRKRSFR